MSEPRDFFISYNRADERWAEWIAWTLTDAGYTHYFQKWDFRPGGNFVLDMQKAAEQSRRTLLVLTPDYLSSVYTQPEWAAAFARDPTGEHRLIVPVRVKPCEPGGVLTSLTYCDLVGVAVDDARRRLLAALEPSGRPNTAPEFPGSTETAFPGPSASAPPAGDPLRMAAEELQALFATTGTTFAAQARLRDQLSARIHRRLAIGQHHEYEELFDLYFAQFQPDELRLHRTIRAYTESVLHDYNKRILRVIETAPRLAEVLPSIPALKQHLIIWLGKFDGVFVRTPSMCLLYVGVEEEAGFPAQIEDELAHYLATGSPAPRIEPSEFNAESPGCDEQRHQAFLADRTAHLRALEQRLAEQAGAEGSDEFYRDQLMATEEAYARLITTWNRLGLLGAEADAWVPRLQALSHHIDESQQPDWPPQAAEAARALHAAAFQSGLSELKLSNALPHLVALKSWEGPLGLAPAVRNAWNDLCRLFRSSIGTGA